MRAERFTFVFPSYAEVYFVRTVDVPYDVRQMLLHDPYFDADAEDIEKRYVLDSVRSCAVAPPGVSVHVSVNNRILITTDDFSWLARRLHSCAIVVTNAHVLTMAAPWLDVDMGGRNTYLKPTEDGSLRADDPKTGSSGRPTPN